MIPDRGLPPLVDAAVEYVKGKWSSRPRFGIILGTGADEVARQIEAEVAIPYREIPGMPGSTAIGHKGELLCGRLAGQSIVAMRGRFHLYEGYSFDQVRLPVELMATLGVQVLFISNAAGGINPRFSSGDLMILESHIDLMFRKWPGNLADPSCVRGGKRADIYDRELIGLSLQFARSADFVLQRGVYAALAGPNYETRAEYRFLRRIGADVVGMSTVPEVVCAANLGLRVLAFSIVANVASPDVLLPTSGQEVVDAAAVAAPNLCGLIVNSIRHLAASSHGKSG
jgi:purine-nucleoside phosphorylase